MRRSSIPVLVATCVAFVFLSGLASAAHPIYRAERDGPALRGYDTVAYFTEGRAMLGSADHEVVWRDTVWRFANAEHKALFEADPERYAPQFGGYCAYAASRNRLYEGHPEVFVIEGERESAIARTRRVRTGRSAGQWIEILEGLKEGDRVVWDGHFALGDGVAVVIDGEG